MEGQMMEFDEMKTIATNTYRIPERITDSILRYALYGVQPGGFVYAVLTNDLRRALFSADKETFNHIHDIVSFAFHELPGNCCGDIETVSKWLARDWEPIRKQAREMEIAENLGRGSL